MAEQPAPRRFWRITIWTPAGVEYRRYIKCPYLVESEDGPESHGGHKYRRPLAPGDADFVDTHLAMTARLGALTWDGVVASYRVSPVPAARVAVIKHRARRWRDVEALLVA